MQNLKSPVMLLLSSLAILLVMRVAFHMLGYDQKVQQAASIAQSLDNSDAAFREFQKQSALADEMQKQAAKDLRSGLNDTTPMKASAPKSGQKPARVIGSFDEEGSGDGFAEETRD